MGEEDDALMDVDAKEESDSQGSWKFAKQIADRAKAARAAFKAAADRAKALHAKARAAAEKAAAAVKKAKEEDDALMDVDAKEESNSQGSWKFAKQIADRTKAAAAKVRAAFKAAAAR